MTAVPSQPSARVGVGFAAARGSQRAAARPEISERERAILALMAEGHSNVAIAHRLSLSERSVKNGNTALFALLGAHDRAHAVAIAMRAGLIS